MSYTKSDAIIAERQSRCYGALAQLVGRSNRTSPPSIPQLTPPSRQSRRKFFGFAHLPPADSLSRPAFKNATRFASLPYMFVPGTTTTIPLLWEKYHGALAQLVARYIRIVEVSGSNPLCSTTRDPLKTQGIFSLLSNRRKRIIL